MTIKNLVKWAAASLVIIPGAACAGYAELFGNNMWQRYSDVDVFNGSQKLSFIREMDGGVGSHRASITYTCNETATALVIDFGGLYNVPTSGKVYVETEVDGKKVDWNWRIVQSKLSTLLTIREPGDKIDQLLPNGFLTVTMREDPNTIRNQNTVYVSLESFDQVVSAFQNDCGEFRS